VFGGFFVLFVPNIAESISRAAPGVIYGVILIVFLFVLPEGWPAVAALEPPARLGMTTSRQNNPTKK
jgi:hypothetical protein